jgi:hypothetical protein
MKTIHFAIFAVLMYCSAATGKGAGCRAATSVEYEPTKVQLSGQLLIARSRHPNGKKLRYPVLRLPEPIAVSGEVGPKNEINSAELCVREIQLYAADKALYSKLFSAKPRTVAVSGTLFHGHTAWHIRKIVMSVTELGPRMGANSSVNTDAAR